MSTDNQGTDEVRNRLLRRADWRFLLPDASPARTVCFVEGELALATELLSQRVSEGEAVASGDCDLAIAVDPDAATLRSAWAALRPGGACYTEWSGVGPMGPPAIRQRLLRMGFESVACFAPWPRPARRLPSAWVPLEIGGALRYLVARKGVARSWTQRLLEGVRRTGWAVRTWLGVGSPICAIARKPFSATAQPGDPAPHADCLDDIRDQWENWGLGPRPSALSWLLLTGGRRSINKVVRLIFAGSDQPWLVLKMPRIAEATAGLRREGQVLHELQTTGRAIGGMPKLLFQGLRAGVPTIIETALLGVPLSTRLSRDTYRDLALQGTDWLVALASGAEVLPPSAWQSRLVDSTVRRFEAEFGSVVDPALIRESANVLATLGPVPMVCEQRDFSPWNLFIGSDKELQVLDWESAEPQGLPMMDLVYFTTYLSFYLERARTPDRYRGCYRETLQASTFTGSVRKQCEEQYAERVGVPRTDIGPLRLLCWMLHSHSEYQQFSTGVVGVPGPAQLRRSLFLSLWEEELQALLQLGPLGSSFSYKAQPASTATHAGGTGNV